MSQRRREWRAMQRAQRKQLRAALKKLQVTPVFAGARPTLVSPGRSQP